MEIRKECNWENKKNFPCVTISKHISNTSKFTSQSIEKNYY